LEAFKGCLSGDGKWYVCNISNGLLEMSKGIFARYQGVFLEMPRGIFEDVKGVCVYPTTRHINSPKGGV